MSIQFHHCPLLNPSEVRDNVWAREYQQKGTGCGSGQNGTFFRSMCLNTGYRQHLLSMVGEVMDMYPVDGIFLDCLNLSACYGVECVDGMKRLGLDVMSAGVVLSWATEAYERDLISPQETSGVPLQWNNVKSYLKALEHIVKPPNEFYAALFLQSEDPWSDNHAYKPAVRRVALPLTRTFLPPLT
jgi:hypothetical protein